MTGSPDRAALPSVDRVLRTAAAVALVEEHGRTAVTAAVRSAIDGLRAAIAGGTPPDPAALDESAVAARAGARLAADRRGAPLAVINLTGTVLHTNLGRAPLPPEAIEAVARVAAGASGLEYDLESGRRGRRDAAAAALVCRLTGAEAATLVNNNAAALLLVLNTLALRREVPVSRGELIEIGGAFRLPEIMRRAGTRLVETGTTNRTHVRDVAQAIGPRTALLLKVHTSNYAIEGFTAAVAEGEMAGLARAHGLPLVVDLGSGSLINLAALGLPPEPTVAATLAAGADLVTFSGDKLLGGPQAGIVAGRADLIRRLDANPMKRALRLDKMTLAALDAVLRLYLEPERLAARLPALRLLRRPEPEIRALAESLCRPVAGALDGIATVAVVACRSQVGSGSLPVDLLPSAALAIRPDRKGGRGGRAVERLAVAFRALPLPVIGRIHDGALVLDLRCLEDPRPFLGQLPRLRP